MSNVSVTVDSNGARIALGKFRLALNQNRELMQEIGNSQLVSVRRTFCEQGSPAGSWAPWAPSTRKRKKPGDLILIGKGRLLNSIKVSAAPGVATLSTSLVYGPVHQFGSRDRGGVAIGPATKEASESTVNVKASSYYRISAELGAGLIGKQRRLFRGPRNARLVNKAAHARHQNIPPRPYLVFRPEDPECIRGIVMRYVNKAAADAGLEGGAR